MCMSISVGNVAVGAYCHRLEFHSSDGLRTSCYPVLWMVLEARASAVNVREAVSDTEPTRTLTVPLAAQETRLARRT